MGIALKKTVPDRKCLSFYTVLKRKHKGCDFQQIDACRAYVVARFEVDASQFGEAWNWLYGVWFPQSGYQPDDKPCFEMYPEEPRDGKFVVDICVPVKAL